MDKEFQQFLIDNVPGMKVIRSYVDFHGIKTIVGLSDAGEVTLRCLNKSIVSMETNCNYNYAPVRMLGYSCPINYIPINSDAYYRHKHNILSPPREYNPTIALSVWSNLKLEYYDLEDGPQAVHFVFSEKNKKTNERHTYTKEILINFKKEPLDIKFKIPNLDTNLTGEEATVVLYFIKNLINKATQDLGDYDNDWEY